MNPRPLAPFLLLVFALGSGVARAAPSASATGKDDLARCTRANSTQSVKDLPGAADLQDADEKLYRFTLFQCDEPQTNKKRFLLRVASVDPDARKDETLDTLPLPPRVLNGGTYYVEPTCNLPGGEQTDAKMPPVIGAIGYVGESNDVVSDLQWVWSFDVKKKKLHLLARDKNFVCATDGAYMP